MAQDNLAIEHTHAELTSVDFSRAGRAAVERWGRQLFLMGANVDAFSFAGLVQADGRPVKDLNDSLLMDDAGIAQLERMLP